MAFTPEQAMSAIVERLNAPAVEAVSEPIYEGSGGRRVLGF